MFALGLLLGVLGTLLLQILGMAVWWYRIVRRMGEKPLAALHQDFAIVRDSIRRVR